MSLLALPLSASLRGSLRPEKELMNNKPAILGNAPIFTTKVPIVRPVLPSFADLASDVEELLTTGMVTKGRHLLAFEEAVAAHLGVRHAVAVSSCTTGLMLTHKCLD